MNSRAFRRGAVAVAAFSATAVVLAACSGGGGGTPSTAPEDITLTLATFNDFGYTDELLAELGVPEDRILELKISGAIT